MNFVKNGIFCVLLVALGCVIGYNVERWVCYNCLSDLDDYEDEAEECPDLIED